MVRLVDTVLVLLRDEHVVNEFDLRVHRLDLQSELRFRLRDLSGDSAFDLIEPLVDGVEPLVDGVEALVDSVEALVDSVEALVDSVEALVDSVEAPTQAGNLVRDRF